MMLDLLEERSKAGVSIRIVGRMTRKISGVEVRKLAPLRLHTRTMVRDGSLVFVGSQSLRTDELDSRREVGVIFRDPKIAARLMKTFARDWADSGEGSKADAAEQPEAEIARKVAKAVAKELPDASPVINGAVKEVVGKTLDVDLNPKEVEEAVKNAVKDAVKGVVSDLVKDAVSGGGR